MADRRIIYDGDEYGDSRRQRRTTSSSSQNTTKGKQRAVSSPQDAPPPYSPPRLRSDGTMGSSAVQPQRAPAMVPPRGTMLRQSQETVVEGISNLTINQVQHAEGWTQFGAPPQQLQQIVIVNEDSRPGSAPLGGESSGHARADPKYAPVQQPYQSTHQRSDSGMTPNDRNKEDVWRKQANAAVKRLVDQGYEQRDAIELVKKQMQKLGQGQGQKQNNDEDDDDDEDDEDDDSSGGEDGDGGGDNEVGNKENAENTSDIDLDVAIRARFPRAIKGRLVWTDKDKERGAEIVKLRTDDIESIRTAVAKHKATKAAIGAITNKNFRMASKFESKLRQVSEDINHGRGVVIVRGLDKAGFDEYESTIAYVGICAHVCPQRAVSGFSGTNLAMEHMYDARQVQAQSNTPELPPTKLPGPLRFHTDRFNGDVLAMYVRDPGHENEGQQYVASFANIYNQLLREHPKTLLTLSRGDWPFTKKPSMHEVPETLPGPILFLAGSDRTPLCQMVLEPLLGEPLVPRPENAIPLSDEQKEALTRVQKLAAQHQYRLERQKGDIQFINNLVVLHARSQYNQKSAGGRYLLRMFLRDPEYALPKPPAPWAAYFDHPFRDTSGGVIDYRDLYPRIAVFLHG